MKHLVQWILALVAISAVANFSGAWTPTQEPPKPKMEKPPAKKLANKNRAAKHEALRKVMPTLKLSLSEAIGLAEKEAGGKAFSAGVEIMEGKPSIQVNLFVNDKFTVADVNPETKKVSVAKRDEKEEGQGEGEGEDDEEGG